MRANQPDYGCPKDTYTLEVKDPTTNTFGTETWLTLDVSTLKMTLALSDITYVAAIDYRLTYNGGDSVTFIVNSCTQITPPSSYLLDPTQSLDLYTTANQVVYQFESYFSGPSVGCDNYFSYELTGYTTYSWMTWDPSAPNS